MLNIVFSIFLLFQTASSDCTAQAKDCKPQIGPAKNYPDRACTCFTCEQGTPQQKILCTSDKKETALLRWMMTALPPDKMNEDDRAKLNKLAYFSGTWKLEDSNPEPTGMATTKISRLEQNQWMETGLLLRSKSDDKSAQESTKGIAVFGYDPKEKVYTYCGFDNMGESKCAKGILEGDTWTLNSTDKVQNKTYSLRFIIKIESSTVYSYKIDIRPEDGEWATVIAGRATRQSLHSNPE